MRLTWHSYSYYPYEEQLAKREIAALFGNPDIEPVANGFHLPGVPPCSKAERLTYFAKAAEQGTTVETIQSRLEIPLRGQKKRQATRYSVHGLHEYKGKFNPQVVRALLNILGVNPRDNVLDPFCGSGTTLVECSHMSVRSYGVDLNPFAVFLANAKLQALATPAKELGLVASRLSSSLSRIRTWKPTTVEGDRIQYLRSWFVPEVLVQIETVRAKVHAFAGALAPIFLMIASNLLRDYSLQDPRDLRIRRRKSPLPQQPFVEAFRDACSKVVASVEATQSILGNAVPLARAEVADTGCLDAPQIFDAAISSPPYAMALPYVDTQRLSLIWLELETPKRIPTLEETLVGSRDLRGQSRAAVRNALANNQDQLPTAELELCRQLDRALGDNDGFRRQAVPVLLYRYFASMRSCLRSIRTCLRAGAPLALIVGRNHTVLGGNRYDIDTPASLASISESVGWRVEESMPLQTYRRYGYHMSNAIHAETLLILRNQ